jgi:hypothetical protein
VNETETETGRHRSTDRSVMRTAALRDSAGINYYLCMLMSTTDTLPGSTTQITESTLVWSIGHKSPQEAEESLANWLNRGHWNACVGVRFETIARPSPVGATSVEWAIYGTAIKW